MILNALVDYYETLAKQGKAARPGWGNAKVSFALELGGGGELLRVAPLSSPSPDGKKSVPQTIILPLQFKRSGSNAPSYFLCDNAQYCLGIENGKVTEKSKRCFRIFREYHNSMLNNANSMPSQTFLKFINQWNPDDALENPVIQENLILIMSGGNFVFRIASTHEYIQNESEVIEIWNNIQNLQGEKAIPGICLVTGKRAEIARIHNSVKGIQTSTLSPNGWTLVGFDKEAFCSYGKEHSFNAPVGKYAAFAYTTALNTLLADRDHVRRFGDATVVFWAEDAEPAYQTALADFLDGGGKKITNDELKSCMEALSSGKAPYFDGVELRPENPFYILALSPNAARLSVRFFLRSSFGDFVKNVHRHYEDINIVGDNRSKFENIPLWALLRETVNMNSKNKDASPEMAGDALRAILSGGSYPSTLYQQTQLRIRAEREITRGRAGIIKAYLTRMQNNEKYREALTVELNENTDYQPYILGRLFSVLEGIQQAANPGINTTIKDKYFTSACATPAVVFPTLLNLAQKHLRKLDGGLRVHYAKQLSELTGRITETYPAHHSLYDQGVFQLGYYHQTQKRFEKKDKTGANMKEEK